MFEVGDQVIYIKEIDEETEEQVFAMVIKDFPLTIYTDEREEIEVNPDDLIPLKRKSITELEKELRELQKDPEWEGNL